MEKCQNCKYYDEQIEDYGDCRRYNPCIESDLIVKPKSEGSKEEWMAIYHATKFPHVRKSDWCGEYRPDGNRASQMDALRDLVDEL